MKSPEALSISSEIPEKAGIVSGFALKTEAHPGLIPVMGLALE
jgi:hypothetical protein